MSRVDRDVPVYPIGVAQKLTGLSGRQIRYYESEGLLKPHRTKGNQRLYSPSDVDLLLKIKSLLEQGLNIEGVRAKLQDESAESADGADVSAEPSPIDHDYVITQMRSGIKLSSLFPVNNQAQLTRFLYSRRSSEERR
mgnify:CR=1 FL=1